MDRLVWIDCEMTGLELSHDLLIEVACIVTDGELNELGDGIDLVITAPAQALVEMDPVVVKMHRESGLDKAVLASTLTVAEAEQQVLAFIKEFVPEAGKAPLCGNSIATDRGFIARDMPELDSYLHEHSLRSKGAPVLAFYDPPWTLPFLRRNEVMVELDTAEKLQEKPTITETRIRDML